MLGLLNEWHGETRPVRTSHPWRLVRAESDGLWVNIGMMPEGTTQQDLEPIAAQRGATPAPQPQSKPGNVLSVVIWKRKAPWTDQDVRNFYVAAMADLGGNYERASAWEGHPNYTGNSEDNAYAMAGAAAACGGDSYDDIPW